MPTETSARPGTERDRWNLGELYANDEMFTAALETFQARMDGVAEHRGHLGDGPARLLAVLSLISRLQEEYQRLSSYARMKLDLDTRDASGLARSQNVDLVGTRFVAAISFVAPEILALEDGTVARFQREEPGLEPFAHQLEDLLRCRPHTLSPSEERLLADAGVMAAAADNVYGILANADLPWPEIVLSTGESIRLDQAAFVKHRSARERSDRLTVFESFFRTWQAYARTFGVTLDAEVKKNVFYARARRYGSALEAALDRNHVPIGVYDAVISAATEGLPVLHRYLKLRARLLGLRDLSYHDIYAPLMASSSRRYEFGQARSLVLAALAPLGEPYVEAVRTGLESRWVDVWASPGKRSGAYSNGSVYSSHPFILMNYSGNFDGVTTLAHELGHAMHSYLANRAQPFAKADYSIFVAEVASTFNEALLYRRCIDAAQDDEERLGLLFSWLDGMRGTFFRQSMFAEFERRIYDISQSGQTLTGEALGGVYLELIRKYYGADQGICAIGDAYAMEWAYIPHFYSDFYVFQYATGFAASTSLARRVLSGAPGAREGYLDFLRAGGSDYPYQLLERAGVDLSQPGPYRDTVAEMNRVMDEIDRILLGWPDA